MGKREVIASLLAECRGSGAEKSARRYAVVHLACDSTFARYRDVINAKP